MQTLHLVAEEIPDNPERERRFAVNQCRGFSLRYGLLDLLPQGQERFQLALDLVFGQILSQSSADDSPSVLGEQRAHHFPQPVALLARLDLATNPHSRRRRQVHEISSRQRYLGRHATPLRPNRLLGDLNDDFLAARKKVLNSGSLAGRSAAVVVVEFGVVRLDEVGCVEKAALFEPNVNERGLHTGQDRLHATVIDVSVCAFQLGTIDQQLYELIILQNSHTRLARAQSRNQYFPFQCCLPASQRSPARRVLLPTAGSSRLYGF